MRQPFTPVLLLLLLVGAVEATQQFTSIPGAIPGTPRWSEGVEASDVDLDGDMDLFFADGDGFTTAGTKRQNVLVINLLEIGAGTFADESVTRLGAHVSNAKQVATGDLTGDGYDEALFANAFGTDLPFLYINGGATDPGVFSFEGAARGFTNALSSGSAQFADIDDDGDLDIVLSDAYLGGPAGKPHLFTNDGAGFFVEDSAFLAALSNKSSQMDVQVVDIDGDWDLDVFIACRAENGSSTAGDHYLMLNDGAGAWTDASEVVLDGASNSVYEIEIGDLDLDQDLDLFFVSLSGFRDGPMENDLAPTGSLGFSNGVAQGGDDDNEVALFDYDSDGDLDALIGSLGPREKFLRNDGNLAFTQLNNVVQSISDSTLDCTVVDLDNDGAYDIVTAQGESNSNQWSNKVYMNSGPPDTLGPVVVDCEDLGGRRANGEWVVHTQVRDAVVDDGKTWVQGEVRWVASASVVTDTVTIDAGGFSNAALATAAGSTVQWTNIDTVAHSIVGTTSETSFDSGVLAPGSSYSRTFIVAGVVAIVDAAGGAGAAQVTVSGAHSSASSLATGGFHRFAMLDLGGQAKALSWELVFTDGAGNQTMTQPRRDFLASASSRTAGANPASYAVQQPPVLGATYDATVDLGSTTGHSFAALFGFDTAVSIPLGGGQVLLSFDLGGAGELLGASAMPGPLAVFQLAVPSDPGLLGFAFSTQALHFGGITPFGLSNAQDLTVGF
ncbi:MAG: plastocyanin [Planctomycetota bacterium]|jgi:plastocyanin